MSHLELKSVHLFSFFFFFLRACACVCVCVIKGWREGGSIDTPGTFGYSVIFKVTHLQVMSRYLSRNSFL